MVMPLHSAARQSSTAICVASTAPWPVCAESEPFMSVMTPIRTGPGWASAGAAASSMIDNRVRIASSGAALGGRSCFYSAAIRLAGSAPTRLFSSPATARASVKS